MVGVRARQSGSLECDAHESAGAAALQFAPFEAAEEGSTCCASGNKHAILDCADLIRWIW